MRTVLQVRGSGHAPKVIGQSDPRRAQLTTLSTVDRTYSGQVGKKTSQRSADTRAPALFWGCSKLSWLDPCFARLVIGVTADVVDVGI